MQVFFEFFQYIDAQKLQIGSLILEHIRLTVLSVACAVSVGVPLGILITYVQRLNKPVLGLANLIQAVPSLALLGFAIPFLGIGTTPAVSMVILYSLLPIVKNTATGLQNINPQMIEAAKGIGLTKFQVLYKIKIPLALPVIMAGVRISAVTAVGLMTIAAFVGAGGLGFLVFSGIRTVNNYQILAGAIPACLLALTVDYTASVVEQLTTPLSLQNISSSTRQQAKSRRRVQIVGLSLAALALAVLYGRAFPKKTQERTFSIGSKEYSEQMILGNMLAELIEAHTDIAVVRRLGLGSTTVLFEALRRGDIQMYIEYGGTAYASILKYPPIPDAQEVYETAKKDFKEKYELEILKPFSFNNTYTLAVRRDTAELYNLDTISDLKRAASRLSIAATLEFLHRPDGLPGIKELYGFQFQKEVGIDGSPRYIALENREVDAVNAYSTDGLLKKFGLKVLKDDQNFFVPYYAMPVIRADAMALFPEIPPLLEKLGPLLTEETMISLNYKMEVEHQEPADVAHAFLVENNLIPQK